MHPIYADFSLSDALLTVLWIFGFVILTWLLIMVFGDLFSDHEPSGWAKALWTIFVIVFPFLASSCTWSSGAGRCTSGWRANRQSQTRLCATTCGRF